MIHLNVHLLLNIINRLKTNQEFITKNVDKQLFLSYVSFINQEQNCPKKAKFVPENIEEGKKLLKRAADNGIKSAMIAYSQLPSSIVDPKEAFFYKKMAEYKNNEN